MLWSDYVSAIAAELAMTGAITNPALAAPSTVADFNTMLARAIEYTELAMLRDPDLDLVAMRTFDSSTQCTASNRNLALPAQIIVPFDLYLITPGGTAPDSGTRNAVQRTSLAFIDMLFPTASSGTDVPKYWALTDNNQASTMALQAKLAPTPASNYTAEWYGIFRPSPLSATNTSNWLSVNLPDLYLAKSMVFWTGYQRNFGAQADDPKMAVSWTMIYDDCKRGASLEEARRRAESVMWTAWAPTRAATPPRQ